MSTPAPTAEAPSRWQVPNWFRRIGVTSWFFIGLVVALALLTALIAASSEITAPLVLAGFLAVVFLPAVDWLSERRIPRGLAAMIVLLGLILLIVATIWLCAAALVDQSSELSASLDAAVSDIRAWLDDTPIDPEVVDRIRETTSQAGPSVIEGPASRVVSLLESAFGLAAGLVLGTVVLYYLLKDLPAIAARRAERETDAERRALIERIGRRSVENIRGYFRGRTAMALVTGVTVGLAALFLGIPAAAAIAVVNLIGAYIPYLGAFVGGAFAVLMALGDGGITMALIMLGIILAENLLLENLLEPMLLGDTLHLHPLLILLVVSLGGLVAGMIGLILAAPAAAIAIDIKTELQSAGFFDDD